MNYASSANSSRSVEQRRRQSADYQMSLEIGDDENMTRPSNVTNVYGDIDNSIPNIDISATVDRRRQSIEGSIIMVDSTKQNSSRLSIDAIGVVSTGDNEYDLGKALMLKRCRI